SGVTLLLLPLLAAIAIPNFVKARQQAQFGQFNQCVQNARQLSLAIRIYANDNNERYPTAKQWCDAVKPFVGGSTRVFTCPQHGDGRCSFAFNQNLDGKKESEADPSTVMIFESDLGWNAAGNASQMIQTPRHGNYTIGFADGHVEQVSGSRLRQLRW